MGEAPLTISELTDRVKDLIEDSIGVVNVIGEISNYTHHRTSGHRYFTLKDESAQLRCVFFRWRASSLDFDPEDGMSVIASGKLTVYKPYGSYQLDVNRLFPAGAGALDLAFRKLKEKLFKEGLFAEEHKRPLPEYPLSVGVITSAEGAAVRDFIRTLHRRAPWINIIIRPTRVQGEGAAEDLASAIEDFNSYEKVDLIVITRGGGSLEDLWAFNEEIVAYAVYNSQIPIISAVGHEIDFTICDFVADARAATPTAAAELVSYDKSLLEANLNRIQTDLFKSLVSILDSKKLRLKSIADHRAFQKPINLLSQSSIRLDHLSERLTEVIANKMEAKRVRVQSLHRQLKAVSPKNTLSRGYSICSKEDGEIIKSSSMVNIGDAVNLMFAEGKAKAGILETKEN